MIDYFKALFPNGGLYIHLDQATERHLPLLKRLEPHIDHFVFDANSNDAVDFNKMNDDEFKTASQMIINKTNYLIDLMHRHNLKRSSHFTQLEYIDGLDIYYKRRIF